MLLPRKWAVLHKPRFSAGRTVSVNSARLGQACRLRSEDLGVEHACPSHGGVSGRVPVTTLCSLVSWTHEVAIGGHGGHSEWSESFLKVHSQCCLCGHEQ